MSQEKIEERTLDVINHVVPLDEHQKSRSTELSSLNLDSLDISKMVMELEEEFDLTIGDDDVKQFKTIGCIVQFIETRTSQ